MPEAFPAFALANTITGFATLLAGCLCVILARLIHLQPRRWRFVYWTMIVAGVFTITLHGFGETTLFGPRWLWAFLDTGSNIVVAWAVAQAVLEDFYSANTQAWARPALTMGMGVGIGWHLYDRFPTGQRSYLIGFSEWGGFYPGESWLIALSWVAVAMIYRQRRLLSEEAMRLLRLVVAILFIGMLLAAARDDLVIAPFLSPHALLHLVSAFGFIALWALNDKRFEHVTAA